MIQPSLQPPGGGNGVAAWMLQALRRDHALSVLSWVPVDLDAINRYYGTSLGPQDLTLLRPARLTRRLLEAAPTPLATARHYALLRQGRRLRARGRFDLLLTANNESDLGDRGLQYVHFPRFEPARPEVDLRWYHSRPAVNGYMALLRRLTGFSMRRMQDNVTLANSDWTGDRLRALFDLEPRTVAPPVGSARGDTAPPWDEREEGFVCLGRISPEKRIELIVRVLSRVRERFPAVRLHVVGSPDDRAYTARVRDLVRDNASWATLHEDLPRAALDELLVRQRYGIHAMADEHFGMAVAEMQLAGCVVFCPDDGGQIEVVDDARLRYRTEDEAVERIERVLGDAALRDEVRRQLRGRADRYSTEHFVEQIRAVVAELLAPTT